MEPVQGQGCSAAATAVAKMAKRMVFVKFEGVLASLMFSKDASTVSDLCTMTPVSTVLITMISAPITYSLE